MKLAFSNSTCPDFDLGTLIEKSQAWGYDGFEVVGLHGQTDLKLAATLRTDPAAARRQLKDSGQQIAALNAGVFTPPAHPNTRGATDRVCQTIELAATIGCSLVVVTGARPPTAANRMRLLERNTTALAQLAAEAARHDVTLALENAGLFATSTDTWHIRDAVGCPALRICLNPLNANRAGDPPSRAIKRLSGALAIVRLTYTDFNAPQNVDRFVELDRGPTNPVFLLEQLKGLAYDGWVCLGWPPNATLPAHTSPEQLLANGAKFLRGEITKPVVTLTAYKGDQNAPTFLSPTLHQPPRLPPPLPAPQPPTPHSLPTPQTPNPTWRRPPKTLS